MKCVEGMAWNVFEVCTALRALGSIMILVVLGVVGVTYYSVVFVNYGPALLVGGVHSLISLAVLFPFHALLVMLLWCYFATIVTDPGGVPSDWKPLTDEENGDATSLVELDPDNVRLNQFPLCAENMRYCRKCNHFKPQRCHHCSVCGRCILKMDHHCVWVVNCVGARNYKFFLLFLFYTFLETSLVALSLLGHFVQSFTDGENSESSGTLISAFVTFVMNFSFALSILGFLIMHALLLLSNTTSIEVHNKKKTQQWYFDLGRKKNFEQVFGMDKRYWLVPAYSEEDIRCMPVLCGLDYPIRPNIDEPA